MEELFKKMLLPSIISSIVFLLLGVIMFIYPELTLEVISKTIGFTIIGIGIVGVFQYLRNREESSFKFNLIYVLTTVILGGLALYRYDIVSSIIPVVLGIWICFDSFIKLRMAIGIKNMGIKNYKYPLIMSIVSLLLGIFLVLNPFLTATFIVRLVAVSIIIYSVIDILQDYTISKYLK